MTHFLCRSIRSVYRHTLEVGGCVYRARGPAGLDVVLVYDVHLPGAMPR